jgi:HlyD family secretion protein
MESLPPIPTPASQRWREFRIRVLPIFFFACVAAVIAFLWRDVAIPPTLAVGFVETNAALVSAPMDGLISQLGVKRFQQVNKGDQICHLVIKDPKILKSEIDVIDADIQRIRITLGPVIDEERTRLAYYQLRLDTMKERGILATETIQLRQAIDDVRQAQALVNQGAWTTNQLENVKTRMETLQASVNARKELIADTDIRLGQSAIAEPGTNSGSPTPIQAEIAVQAAKIKQLEATFNPIPLVAPISGMITAINRHSGEYLRAGDPILAISANESEQIVGYIRQPINIQPRVGMPIQVRARTPNRETASATVTQVGAQMESFSMAMVPNAPNPRLFEFGLPILVTLPPAMKLVPGELVDLILDPK